MICRDDDDLGRRAAIAAARDDPCVRAEHGRDAERVPDAVAVRRVARRLDHERRRHRGEGRRHQDLAAVALKDEDVRLGQAAERLGDAAAIALRRRRHGIDRWRRAAAHRDVVDVEAGAPVEVVAHR